MNINQILHCCGCDKLVNPRLTDGAEIYPHRKDLSGLPFWKCDDCNNYVGCHHKTKDSTKPLGCIPTSEIRAIRMQIHKTIDSLWRDLEGVSRKRVYKEMSCKIGEEFHTANIKTIAEARKALSIARIVEREIVISLPF